MGWRGSAQPAWDQLVTVSAELGGPYWLQAEGVSSGVASWVQIESISSTDVSKHELVASQSGPFSAAVKVSYFLLVIFN